MTRSTVSTRMLPGSKGRRSVETAPAAGSEASVDRTGGAEVITELPPGVAAWFTVIVPNQERGRQHQAVAGAVEQEPCFDAR